MKNNNFYNKVLFAGLIVLLFIISYLRFSYYINPNFSGEPVWIKIAGARMDNLGLLDFNENNTLDINNMVKAKSIIVFWFLFGILNFTIFKSWRNQQQDTLLFFLTWGGLTLLIIFFMGLHFLFRPEQVFFGLFTKIKNFLLSPLYTGVIFIFAKFFNRLVQ